MLILFYAIVPGFLSFPIVLYLQIASYDISSISFWQKMLTGLPFVNLNLTNLKQHNSEMQSRIHTGLSCSLVCCPFNLPLKSLHYILFHLFQKWGWTLEFDTISSAICSLFSFFSILYSLTKLYADILLSLSDTWLLNATQMICLCGVCL